MVDKYGKVYCSGCKFRRVGMLLDTCQHPIYQESYAQKGAKTSVMLLSRANPNGECKLYEPNWCMRLWLWSNRLCNRRRGQRTEKPG